MDLKKAEEIKQMTEKIDVPKHDLRYIKTEAGIQNAFLHLLQTKKFGEITVQDILDYALINRKTFYNHYKDKYDLLDKMMNDSYDELQSYYSWRRNDARNPDTFSKYTEEVYKKIYESRERFLTLWDIHVSSPSISSRMIDFFKQEYASLSENISSDVNFQKNMYASMQVGLIRGILESDEPFTYERMRTELTEFSKALEKYTLPNIF